MKVFFRNFVSIFRRYKLAMVLNVLGLSVAFAVFMIIMIQLNYDFGFDKFHKDYDKIFRLEYSSENQFQSVLSRPFAEQFFESSPYIIAGGFTNFRENPVSFYVEKDGEQIFYEENSLNVAPSFFDVFTFNFVEGSNNSYLAPGKIFIPLSLARKLFGDELAVGKQIVHSRRGLQTVQAVYRDLPANSIFRNGIYFDIEGENEDNWRNNNYVTYIRVNDPSNVPLIIDNFKRNFEPPADRIKQYNWEEDSGIDLRLTALEDIHYVTDVDFDNTPKASKQTLLILFTIAIVVVIIAGINFTNFSTSLAPMRVRNINIQRVLGAHARSLRLSIILETVIVSFLSYLLAICFVMMFGNTQLTSIVNFDLILSRFENVDLTMAANPMIFFGTALIALITGFFAGLFPSFYMTSFAPAMALNSHFGLTPKGKKLRNILIVIQYVASFALIIGASFMYLQNYSMQHLPMGYEKDALITADISSKIAESHDALSNQLKAYSGIEEVTYSSELLSSKDDGYWGWGREYKGEMKMLVIFSVQYSFLKVMGIEITEGRDFRQDDAGVLICNETARKKYDMEVETDFGGIEIIGFVSDVNFASLRKEVEPMAFYVPDALRGFYPEHVYIKIKAGANKHAAKAYIHSTLAEFDPDYTFNVRFYDEVLQKLYEKEIALNSLITFFSLIAIFISIVGVFGLVIFENRYRRKEIGIRKVFGASATDILIMFNKMYFKILLISVVIATPLAWYVVNRWLQNFVYKTPMYWWVYLLAFVVVGIITSATITFQNWRVANENPAEVVKTE